MLKSYYRKSTYYFQNECDFFKVRLYNPYSISILQILLTYNINEACRVTKLFVTL